MAVLRHVMVMEDDADVYMNKTFQIQDMSVIYHQPYTKCIYIYIYICISNGNAKKMQKDVKTHLHQMKLQLSEMDRSKHAIQLKGYSYQGENVQIIEREVQFPMSKCANQ